MEESTNPEDLQPIRLKEINKLIDSELGEINDPRPTNPPKETSINHLKENIHRWKNLRDTGCQHMQEFIAYVQSKGDAPWYSKGMLDGIQEIIDGASMYDAEGVINPKKAEELRKKYRKEHKLS